MILLVGVSVRALMESALESGYKVSGIDFFGDIDMCRQKKIMCLATDFGLKSTVKNLMQVAKTIPCQGLVYTSGPENAPMELHDWEKKGLLLGNGSSVLTRVRDPGELSGTLEEIGARMPKSVSVKEWIQNENGRRKLLKILNRGGGHGVIELPKSIVEAEIVISKLEQSNQSAVPCMIQDYVEGTPGSVTFLANGQKAVLLGTSRQLIGRTESNKPFIYTGNIVPLNVHGTMHAETFEKEITRIIQHLTAGFGLKGINTLDFIVNQEGIWVLELNPRWSASVELIERYLGQRLFTFHIAASLGKVFQPLSVPKRASVFWGKRIVYARESGVINSKKNLQYLFHHGIRDIPRSQTRIEKGQPICTVLANGVSDLDCDQRLLAKAEWIRETFEQEGMDVAY